MRSLCEVGTPEDGNADPSNLYMSFRGARLHFVFSIVLPLVGRAVIGTWGVNCVIGFGADKVLFRRYAPSRPRVDGGDLGAIHE